MKKGLVGASEPDTNALEEALKRRREKLAMTKIGEEPEDGG